MKKTRIVRLSSSEVAKVIVHIPWGDPTLNPLRESNIEQMDFVPPHHLPPPILRRTLTGALKTADGRHRVTRAQRRGEGLVALVVEDKELSHHFGTSVTGIPPVMA